MIRKEKIYPIPRLPGPIVPSNGVTAIEELEQLWSNGAEFLLAPRNAFTFFERYPDVKEYLDHHYRLVEDDDICRIYDVRETLWKTSRTRQEPKDYN
jgi:hypothetical protein